MHLPSSALRRLTSGLWLLSSGLWLLAPARAQPTSPPTSGALIVHATTGAISAPVSAATFVSGNSLLTTTAAASGYQPLDSDLTAIAGLTTTADGRSLLTASALTAAGLGVLNGAALDALGALSTTGILARTGSGAYATRTLTGTAGQVSVANGAGVAGNPTLALPLPLTLGGTSTSYDDPALVIVRTVDGSSGVSGHGFVDDTTVDSGLSYAAFDVQVGFTGSKDYAARHFAGFQSNGSYAAPSALAAWYGYTTSFANNGGTIGSWYGARINAPTGSGTITNKYGLYIEPLGTGYQLYLADAVGKAYIGGALSFGDTTFAAGEKLIVRAGGVGTKPVVIKGTTGTEIIQFWADGSDDGQLWVNDASGNNTWKVDGTNGTTTIGSAMITNSAIAGFNSVTAAIATNLTLAGGSSGASLTLGQGASGVSYFTNGAASLGVGTNSPGNVLEIKKDQTGRTALRVNNDTATGFSGVELYDGSTPTAAFQFQNNGHLLIDSLVSGRDIYIRPNGVTSAIFSESGGVAGLKPTNFALGTAALNDHRAIHIVKAYTDATAGYGIHSTITASGAVSAAGVHSAILRSGAEAADHIVAVQAAPSNGGTNTLTNVYSFYELRTHSSGSTTTNSYAFHASPPVGTGTVTNAFGLYVGNQGAAGITNAYGIDIAAQSGAVTTNIGLRNAGLTSLTNATEATTGGAGSLTTAGGIYAAKAIIANGALITSTRTPASATDTGVAGTITWDSDYIYICTSTNTWKRVAIAAW